MIPNFRHALLGGTLALSTALCLAAPPREMPPGPPPGQEPEPPYLHGLDLSPEQRDKIFDILHAQAPALHARENAVRQAHEQLRQLSLNTSFDETRAKSFADGEARAIADIALLHARSDNRIYQLLTPEQRKRLGSNPPHDGDCGAPSPRPE